MKKITEWKKQSSQYDSSFFPRIIREFDDGYDEKPMYFGDE